MNIQLTGLNNLKLKKMELTKLQFLRGKYNTLIEIWEKLNEFNIKLLPSDLEDVLSEDDINSVNIANEILFSVVCELSLQITLCESNIIKQRKLNYTKVVARQKLKRIKEKRV